MTYIALASNAVRSGIVAAHNLAGTKLESVGVQGSNGINIWDLDHLKLFKNGAYLVDRYGQTSDKNVYAVGDCATIYSNALDKMTYIALASNAVRSGIVAAHNLAGTKLESVGVQGSNGINIWD